MLNLYLYISKEEFAVSRQ